MTKIVLQDVASFTNETAALNTVNSNSAIIEAESDNFLSRDGTTPNEMLADLDMNSNSILNLPAPSSANEPLRLQDLADFIGGSLVVPQPGGSVNQVQYNAGGVPASFAGDSGFTYVPGTGVTVTTGLNVGFTGTPATAVIEIGDANFQLTWATGTTPALIYDSQDFASYTRSTNTFNWSIANVSKLGINTAAIFPGSNDGLTLGTTTNQFSDLFLATGAVINFNNGDVLLTHAANVLQFSGAASGYSFDNFLSPISNDGAVLGSATVSWADLFLASGAVVNFNNGNYTLTHSAGLLTTNGALSLGTSNILTCGTIELGNASDTTLSRSAAGDLAVEGNPLIKAGKHSIWIPAVSMTARTTNGPSTGTVEMTTNKNMVKTLDFDTTTQEFAQFDIRMPKSWNESTVTFIPVWSHAATATNFGVVWGLDAVAVSDDDTLDVAFGTEQTSTDTGGTTNDSYQGPESAAITVSGTPAENDLVMFRIHRDPANGSDTMAIDARLHGILLFYTINASTDA